jgi:hypothetical protein
MLAAASPPPPARSPAAGGPAATLASGLDGNHITPINAHQKQLGQQAPGTPEPGMDI